MTSYQNEVLQVRSRPAFEKLLIGPVMVLGEMVTGGHYLEVLRLGKQMAVGHATAPSYLHLHRNLVSETGFVGAFYRGFMPWGLLQCAKGIPVLFVQNESMYQLQARAGWSQNRAEQASGFLGGAAQAIFVTPMQKLKVSVVACDKMNAMSPLAASQKIVRKHGLTSLYDGVVPMVMRRSLDWGIRFTVSNHVKNFMLRRKQQNATGDGEQVQLNIYELIVCGLVGGASSALTHPIDNIITNSMKPLPRGESRSMLVVMRRMYFESGVRGFTRGWGIKILDNAYHMAWMYGIGTVVYDTMRRAMKDL